MSDRKWSEVGEMQMADYTTKICTINGNTLDNKTIKLTSLLNTPNFFFVRALFNANDNAYQLQDAYNRAKTALPAASATNRITVVVAPGKYDFTNMPSQFGPRFKVDAQYIDIVSLTGNRDVILNGIIVTANDVFIKGVNCKPYGFGVDHNLNLLKLDNCEGGEGSFCSEVNGSDIPFNFSGLAINCEGGSGSFGGDGGIFSGKAYNCKGGSKSFGGWSAFTSTGEAYDCVAGELSFGGGGNFSGLASNCIGGFSSFGGGSGMFSGTGKAYYCRLTSGAFNVPLSGGKQILCIDGNNNVITR